MGLYEQAEEVESYLETAQVTLVFTPTATLDDEDTDSTSDQPLTSGTSITSTLQPTLTETLDEEAESSTAGKNRIVVEPLGEMAPATTSLLLLQSEKTRQVMVALADSEMLNGRIREARKYLRRAKRLNPREPEVWDGLTRLAQRTGQERREASCRKKAEQLRIEREIAP